MGLLSFLFIRWEIVLSIVLTELRSVGQFSCGAQSETPLCSSCLVEDLSEVGVGLCFKWRIHQEDFLGLNLQACWQSTKFKAFL